MKTQTLAAALCLLAGCHSTNDLATDNGVLRVDTTPLDFGTVPLTVQATRTIALQNTSEAPIQVLVITQAPFAGPAAVGVPAGTTVMLALTFSPQVAGAASGTVELDWATAKSTISLKV